MARKHQQEKKHSPPKQAEKVKEPRVFTPRKRVWRPGTFARLAAALAIGTFAVWSTVFMVHYVRAVVMGTIGNAYANRPNGLLIAEPRIREAHEMAPEHPELALWLASTLIQYENSNAMSGNLDAVNFNRLNEALNLLGDALDAHFKPSTVNRQAAEMANMMATFAKRKNEPERAAKLNEVAAKNYLEYRYQQGRPYDNVVYYYRGAIPAVFENGKPHLALMLRDDFLHYFPDQEKATTALGRDIGLARLQMGEFNLYFAEESRRLFRDPANLVLYDDMLRKAQQTGQLVHAYYILAVLEEQGKLPQEVHPVVGKLATVVAEQRGVKNR